MKFYLVWLTSKIIKIPIVLMKKKKRTSPRVFRVRRSFKKEFKRQLRFAITAAIGFTIAFSWRNAVYNASYSIVDKFASAASSALSEAYTAIFITLVGVAVIFLTSKILRDRK